MTYNTQQFIEAVIQHQKGASVTFKDAVITYSSKDLPKFWQDDSASVTGLNFDGASFIDCDIRHLNFINCSMNNVDFSHSILSDCDFINCNITTDRTHDFKFSDNGGFSSSKLFNVNFYDSHFNSTSFTNCKMEDCYYSGCEFTDSILNNVNVTAGAFYQDTFTNASFTRFVTNNNPVFDSCTFTACPIYKSAIYNCLFRDTSITDSRIMKSSFAYSDLRQLKFSERNNEILDVNFEKSIITPTDIPWIHRGYFNVGKDNLSLSLSYGMNKSTGRISCEDLFGSGNTLTLDDFRKRIQSGAIVDLCMNKYFENLKNQTYSNIRMRIAIKNSFIKNYKQIVDTLKDYRSEVFTNIER